MASVELQWVWAYVHFDIRRNVCHIRVVSKIGRKQMFASSYKPSKPTLRVLKQKRLRFK